MCRRLRHRFADWLHRLTFTATLHASLNPSRYSQTQAVVSGKGKPSIPHDFFQLAYLTRSLQCTTWSISLTDRGHRICRVSVNADPMVSAISRGASPSVLPGFVNAKEVGDCSLDAWCFDEFCEFTTEERNPPWKNGGHPSIVTSPYRSNMENLCFLGVSGDIFFKGSIGRQSICL